MLHGRIPMSLGFGFFFIYRGAILLIQYAAREGVDSCIFIKNEMQSFLIDIILPFYLKCPDRFTQLCMFLPVLISNNWVKLYLLFEGLTYLYFYILAELAC